MPKQPLTVEHDLDLMCVREHLRRVRRLEAALGRLKKERDRLPNTDARRHAGAIIPDVCLHAEMSSVEREMHAIGQRIERLANALQGASFDAPKLREVA